MTLKPLMAAVVLSLSGAAAQAATADLVPLTPSASFSNTVSGAFNDVWTFNLGTASVVAASITNVEVSFASSSVGGIQGFSAWLNGVQLFGPTSSITAGGVTIKTQVLAGGTSLPAGIYELRVSGTGVTGGNASYGGNIVASAVPEPHSYALLLAGLAVVACVARRRKVGAEAGPARV